MSAARRKAGTMATFAAIAAMPAAANLLLTLLLLRTLSIEAFAAWSIVEPLLLIFSGMATLGTHFAVLYFSTRDELDPRLVLGASFLLSVPLAMAIGAAIGGVFNRFDGHVAPMSLILPLVGDASAILVTAALRGQRRLTLWACFEAVRSLGLVVLTVAAMGLAPRWIGSLDHFLLMRGLLTIGAVAVGAVVLRTAFSGSLAIVGRLLRYGLPASGASILGLAIANADRFLLAGLGLPAATIASYATHQRIAGLLATFTVQPLSLWFPVEAIRRDPVKEPDFFRGVLAVVVGALTLVAALVFTFTPLVWDWILPQITFDPLLYAILTLAVVPRALFVIFNIGGLREKHTHQNAVAIGVTGGVLLATGVPFTLLAAGVGAASARLVSLAVQAGAINFLSQRIAPVRYDWRAMLPFAAALATSVAIAFDPGGVVSVAAIAATAILIGIGLKTNRGDLVRLWAR